MSDCPVIPGLSEAKSPEPINTGFRWFVTGGYGFRVLLRGPGMTRG
jgi:hypothetical protein